MVPLSPYHLFRGEDKEVVAETAHEDEGFTQAVTRARSDDITQVLLEQQIDNNALQMLQQSIGVEIRVLVVLDRGNLPSANYAGSPLHWIPQTMAAAEGVASMYLSHPYRRSFVPDSGNWQRVEPCVVVVGNRVVMCIEVFISSSDVIVYRDVVASLETTLCDVLIATACALGLSK